MAGVRDGVTAKRRRFSGVLDVAGALMDDRCVQSFHSLRAVARANQEHPLQARLG